MKTHRWVGLTSAIFLVMLTLTGIALQHPVTFGLEQRFVQSPTLLSWYGIKLEGATTTFKLDDNYLILADGQVYWRYNPLLQIETLTGATLVGDTLAFTDQSYLYLFDALTLDPLEHIKAPANIHQFGSANEAMVFRSVNSWYQLSRDETEFVAIPALAGHTFRSAITIPSGVQSELNAITTSRFISWQRLLSDLHSGRLFGEIGPLVIDLVALAILLLAVTGLWNWSMRRRLP